MSEREDSDSNDAPEELTSEQGILQDEGIRKVQKENKARVVREGKERRRLWAERKTPRPSGGSKTVQDDPGTEPGIKSPGIGDMLPNDVVQLLAAREKYLLFFSCAHIKFTCSCIFSSAMRLFAHLLFHSFMLLTTLWKTFP
uniref:Uncharacterized protein MANES_13G131900 n=1 Tax=Rhizophora mucronata TaxID=61149 RepID=A0A2P2KQ43_RHIMU